MQICKDLWRCSLTYRQQVTKPGINIYLLTKLHVHHQVVFPEGLCLQPSYILCTPWSFSTAGEVPGFLQWTACKPNFAISKEPEAMRLSLLSFKLCAFLHPDYDNTLSNTHSLKVILKKNTKQNLLCKQFLETVFVILCSNHSAQLSQQPALG